MTATKILDPAILSSIKDLSLLAKVVVEGFQSGIHKSSYNGSGIEFVQYRNYVQGDDIKFIDWKALARTDKYYTKIFEEETNMDCHIILDCSSSMSYQSQSKGVSKWTLGQMLAATFLWLSHHQGDKIGCSLINDHLIYHQEGTQRKDGLLQALVNMANTTPSGLGFNENIKRQLINSLHNRGLLVYISDCLSNEEDVISFLSLMQTKYDCLLVHLLDQDEINLPFKGSNEFIDIESNQKLITSAETIRDQYHENLHKYLTNLQKSCYSKNIEYFLTNTHEDLAKSIIVYLANRNRLTK